MKWKNISLYKYQQIEEVNKQDLPDIDKVLFSACFVFDMTEHQLDNTAPAKVMKMTTKMQKIFETPFCPKASTKIGRYVVNYDVSKMTFGQYIELAFFLADKAKATQYAHYVLATCSRQWIKKHTTRDHRKKAEYFLNQPVEIVIGSLNMIIDSFNRFNIEYKSLFGIDPNVSGNVQNDDFNKRHGWIYSATQVARHEGIKLDDAFVLPIRQALNDLIYLKAKEKYEAEQLRKPIKSIA